MWFPFPFQEMNSTCYRVIIWINILCAQCYSQLPDMKWRLHSVQYLADHVNIYSSTFTILPVVSVAIGSFQQGVLGDNGFRVASTYRDSSYVSDPNTSPDYLPHLCIVARTTPVRTRLPPTSLLSVTTLFVRIQAVPVASEAYLAGVRNILLTQPFQMPWGTMQNSMRRMVWTLLYGLTRVGR